MHFKLTVVRQLTSPRAASIPCLSTSVKPIVLTQDAVSSSMDTLQTVFIALLYAQVSVWWL